MKKKYFIYGIAQITQTTLSPFGRLGPLFPPDVKKRRSDYMTERSTDDDNNPTFKKYSTRDGYMLLPLADFGFRLVSLKIWTYFIMLIVRYLIVFLNHDYATSGVDVIK